MLVVYQRCEIAAVVQDQVEVLAVLEGAELLLQAPIVLFFGFTLPGEDGGADCSDGGGGVVLGREDVA